MFVNDCQKDFVFSVLINCLYINDQLTAAEDWVGLHKEQVNASRTVQQVQANLRELERARAQVYDDDIGQFDSQVQEVRIKSVAAVENFLKKSQVKDLTPGNQCHTICSF